MGYEPNTASPNFFADDSHPNARKVYSRVTVLRMEEINTIEQTWTAELFFEFVLALDKRGPPHAFDAAKRRELALVVDTVAREGAYDVTAAHPFAKVFWPKLSSTRESKEEEAWITAVGAGDARRGAICREEGLSEGAFHFFSFSLRTKSVFSQRFQLELFPFDVQLLMARVVVRQDRSHFVFATSAENERVFCAGGAGKVAINAVNGAFSPMLGEWKLHNHTRTVACLSASEASRTESQYPVLKTLLLVRRRTKYYTWLVIAPLFVTLALSGFALVLNNSDTWETITTLLFTAVSIKTQMSSMLPRMGKLTLLDQFCVFVTGHLFLTAVLLAAEDMGFFVSLNGSLSAATGLAVKKPAVDALLTLFLLCGVGTFVTKWFFIEPFRVATRAIYKSGKKLKQRHVRDQQDTDIGCEEWPVEHLFHAKSSDAASPQSSPAASVCSTPRGGGARAGSSARRRAAPANSSQSWAAAARPK